MEGFLYHSRPTNVDVQNSYENIVCLMSHLVPETLEYKNEFSICYGR
jgi:hypothetical protein